jgi:autoinducer 2-degrading protein
MAGAIAVRSPDAKAIVHRLTGRDNLLRGRWVRATLAGNIRTRKERAMLIVHVHVRVKADQAEAFRAVSIENAKQSVKEPGVARFDVIQQQDDPTRFVLVEVYRTADDPAGHKETAHYKKWRDTVESMMAEPRTSVKYINVFPDERGWNYASR